MRRTTWLLPLSLALALGCDDPADDDDSGDSGDSETSGEPTPDFDAEVQPILEAACLCHFMPSNGGDMTAPYLTLNLGVGVGEMVDVNSVQLPSMMRVAPGDVENSYLVHKLRGTHADVGGPSDTDPMPPLQPLSASDQQTIEAWIAGGAPG
ncbi:hypothetical protein ENSA5_40520 [Enhygromyxa salina]|uniref:Cytochrome c domain-containing protein n=1 Tax=Enhygromyxa salina TaxID=215803 RepID=A0A2S9XPD4_9BACT|nr:hypothetical protein [Enhygromyxa salina]PRP94729.1 hypothetical protein ENSA5_40520 [Enhygromyxa salina]